MNNPKADSMLNLSLSVDDTLRERSLVLSAAQTDNIWELIVLASEDISFLSDIYPQIRVSMLYENFAIIQLPVSLIPVISELSSIIYIELPKYVFFETLLGKRASCISFAEEVPFSLSGRNVLVGIVDSGIDLAHPDFQNADGSSRVLYLWDQDDDSGIPPYGTLFGTEYDNEQINTALKNNITLSEDFSGHGSAVCGIACGNGSASNGRYRGVAPDASIIVVKMRRQNGLYPRTVELISGIDYCIRKSLELSMPLALNISFGNNYGSHTGSSLIETYLNRVSLLGRISIVVSSGNEGASPIHTFGTLMLPSRNDFSVSERQTSLNIQFWKDYSDIIRISLVAPNGSVYSFPDTYGSTVFSLDNTLIAFYNSQPSPFQRLQEYYLEFFADTSSGNYITPGIWSIKTEPVFVRNGLFDMWLPSASSLNLSTRFLSPVAYNTLTIPSCASSVISVGAYDVMSDEPAFFSGRGSLGTPAIFTKPDLSAPGVSVIACAPSKTYQTVSGTSFSAPFVTGSAALLMEWGIVRRNNPFLYGERLKAWLISGTRDFEGFPSPNPVTGWGALCLRNSFR